MILGPFGPYGSFYTYVEPVEVVDVVPEITYQDLCDVCVRNLARAHMRRLHARYEALPGFFDVTSESGSPDHASERVAEVHEVPFFGKQGPQRRTYEVMSFCSELRRDHVPLHRFHRLVYTNALLFPVKGI